MVIDTWLLAGFILCLLVLVAGIRMIRIRSFYDRKVAMIVTLCLVAAAGLILSIFSGTLFILHMTILIVLVCFVMLAARVRSVRGEQA